MSRDNAMFSAMDEICRDSVKLGNNIRIESKQCGLLNKCEADPKQCGLLNN